MDDSGFLSYIIDIDSDYDYHSKLTKEAKA